MSYNLEDMKESALEGDNGARMTLGWRYLDGEDGAKVDLDEALKWFEMSAADGNPYAFTYVGIANERKGYFKEAIQWYKKLIEMDVETLQNSLNNFFDDLNYKDVLAMAQYQYATLFEDGNGVTKDLDEALKWHLKAADNGLAISRITADSIYNLKKSTAEVENLARKQKMKDEVQRIELEVSNFSSAGESSNSLREQQLLDQQRRHADMQGLAIDIIKDRLGQIENELWRHNMNDIWKNK